MLVVLLVVLGAGYYLVRLPPPASDSHPLARPRSPVTAAAQTDNDHEDEQQS